MAWRSWVGRSGGRRAAWRRVVLRRVLAATLAGWAVALVVAALTPPPAPRGTTVLVASHDLPAGAVVADTDLREATLPADAVPATAARSAEAVIGRVVAGPVSTGEMFTATRLVGDAALAGQPPGTLAVRLPAADPDEVRALSPGARVTAYLPGHDGAVVSDVVVLAVQPADASTPNPRAALVVAASRDQARRVYAALDPGASGAGFGFAVSAWPVAKRP